MKLREIYDQNELLMAMYQKVREPFHRWCVDNDYDVSDEESLLNELENYLYEEYTLSFEYGCVTFYDLSDEVRNIIGNLPVLLYHFTSSKLVPSIKAHGLKQGIKKTNPHKNSYAGIYLTSNPSGKEVEGYKYHAVQKHKGVAVRIDVKCYLDELAPDPDDEGIKSGNFQFVVDYLPPDRIMNIETVF